MTLISMIIIRINIKNYVFVSGRINLGVSYFHVSMFLRFVRLLRFLPAHSQSPIGHKIATHEYMKNTPYTRNLPDVGLLQATLERICGRLEVYIEFCDFCPMAFSTFFGNNNSNNRNLLNSKI